MSSTALNNLSGSGTAGSQTPECPATSRNGSKRLINKKIERNLPRTMNTLLRRNAYKVAAAKEAAREKVTESLKRFSATLERRLPIDPETRQLQRARNRQIQVRSMSGEEQYFDVSRWPQEPMTQLEFFQCVRRRFNIPTNPTPISICLLFIGRQPGWKKEMERWHKNEAMQCHSGMTVPETMRGTIWQLVTHR